MSKIIPPSQEKRAKEVLLGMPPPAASEILFTIDFYQILKSIGKGGMGEVFLAYDPHYGRHLAIKRIRSDLVGNPAIFNRFVKEARITSQLTHPAIIPIYAIRDEDEMAYYTMPYVEGETLKQVLIRTKKQQQQGLELDHTGASIPALIRIFLSVCQAVSYAHARRVLHRDLKPENIIIGKFGEVLMLDWGLAQLMKGAADEPGELPENVQEASSETHLGKVVGTIAYMAPERSLGLQATIQTDIYALGVTLYQLLTLRMPFQRKTLKEFRKKAFKEKLPDPIQAAPYRDIPPLLAHITTKCLSAKAEERYSSINALIHDVQNYLEGRSEWLHMANLDISNKRDWEFQEHIFLGEHMAITRHAEAPEWVNLMISKASFTGNTKLEAKIRLGERCHGLGFLLSIPEASQREHLNDGYCLWLSSDRFRTTKLLCSAVEVMRLPDLFLARHIWHEIRIEKLENNIHLYINGLLQLSYISYMPLTGTHMGMLSRDADFCLQDFTVFVGNLNLTVSCLAIADAFLARKEYSAALSEYRRIAYSFPGRAEEREALFRAGITLLEQGRCSKAFAEKQIFFDESLAEFTKLHGTPGAPLEYLGKSLVYKEMGDFEEEGKCFELGLRRYPHHPLLPVLTDRLTYRMHEAARYDRKATYNFIILAVRHIPDIADKPHVNKLFTHLCNHWEPLPFLEQQQNHSSVAYTSSFATALAFWLVKPHVLEEIIEELFKEKKAEENLRPPGNAKAKTMLLGHQRAAPKEVAGPAEAGEAPNSALLDKAQQSIPVIEKRNFAEKSAILTDALFAALEIGFVELVEQKFADERLAPYPLELLRCCVDASKGPIDAAVYELLNSSYAQEETICFDLWRALSYLIEKALLWEQEALVHRCCDLMQNKILPKGGVHQLACWRLFALLQERQWDNASAIFQQFSPEQLCHEDSLLPFLYICWLEATEGHEIAMVHFSGILETPYPRTWTLATHYLAGKLSDKRGWPEKAFLWERKQLYRQLALYHLCRGEPELSERYKNQCRTLGTACCDESIPISSHRL